MHSLAGNNLATNNGELPVEQLQAASLEVGAKAFIEDQEVYITSPPDDEGNVGVSLIPIMPIVEMLKTNVSLQELKCVLPYTVHA